MVMWKLGAVPSVIDFAMNTGVESRAVELLHTTGRVPGITRNSGWQAVDAAIAARRTLPVTTRPTHPSKPEPSGKALGLSGENA